jgi:AcrR family transcriptional regulator
MKAIHQVWILEGYKLFALQGSTALKIEVLAKLVGKNKSSFYNRFADLEIFTTELLEYHTEQAKIIAEKEAQCTTSEDLIQVFVEHKTDLLFNRQLRINTNNVEFQKCVEKLDKHALPLFLPLWSKIIGLENNSYLAELVLQLSLQNFYLQINHDNLNAAWLGNYFNQSALLIKEMKKQAEQKVKR